MYYELTTSVCVRADTGIITHSHQVVYYYPKRVEGCVFGGGLHAYTKHFNIIVMT